MALARERDSLRPTSNEAAERPRVLLTCDWLLKYTAGLAGGLGDAGADVLLVTRDHAMEFGGDAAEMSAHLDQLMSDEVALVTLSGRTRDPRTMSAVSAIRRQRRQFDPHVVHLQQAVENDPRLIAMSGLRRGRFVYTVHDPVLHPGDSAPSRHVPFLRRWLLRNAGLIFVHAESLRDELVQVEHISAPVEVVPHGTAASPVQPLPAQPSILLFGRLSEYKGIDVMLDAMPQIWERFPAVRLVVAGEGNLPEHPGFDDPRVDLRRGHVSESDIPALFGDATVVALPYVQASQSGVGSLAKSYGRGMVVTSVGGLPELVSDGSGVVVAPRDPGALATAMTKLLDDPQAAAEMGLTGARVAAAQTGWKAVGEATLAAYERHGLL